jgi:hypothetical protein
VHAGLERVAGRERLAWRERVSGRVGAGVRCAIDRPVRCPEREPRAIGGPELIRRPLS